MHHTNNTTKIIMDNNSSNNNIVLYFTNNLIQMHTTPVAAMVIIMVTRIDVGSLQLMPPTTTRDIIDNRDHHQTIKAFVGSHHIHHAVYHHLNNNPAKDFIQTNYNNLGVDTIFRTFNNSPRAITVVDIPTHAMDNTINNNNSNNVLV